MEKKIEVSKCYCILCDKEVNPVIQFVAKKYKDDVMDIEYDGVKAICPVCQEELHSDDVFKYNQEQIKEKYKQEYEIITNCEIEEIIKKYNIGKRPLSLLLDFGEITITRYLSGYIPTQTNSKKLKQILASPSEYYSILQMNKHKIKDVAFRKSEQTVRKLLNLEAPSDQIEDAAKYIVNKIEVTNLALQKLLYYVQVFFSAFNNKLAFSNKCSAWEYGPVFGIIYHKYKKFGKNPISDEEPRNELTTELKETIDFVIKYFGCFTGSVLMNFTHKEEPWKQSFTKEEQEIDKEDLMNFGKKVISEYEITSISEINKYSKKMLLDYLNNI